MNKLKNYLVFLLFFIIGLHPAIFAEENTDTKVLAEGNNAFAINLYNRLKTQDGNLFFSPYSISTALSMVYAGARGNTEKQIAETLCFPFNHKQLHPAFSNLSKNLNSLQENNKIELNVANVLWAQKDYIFLKEFLDLNKIYYDAEPASVDFKNDSEAVRRRINKWVEEKTKNKIKDLMQPGDIDSLTRLILINAVYFKSDWFNKFEKQFTKDASFKLLSGKSTMVKMMNRDGEYRYVESTVFQILELPYKGNNVSMIIFLPKKEDGLIDAEKLLNIAYLKKWTELLSKKEVEVYMPKFKITSTFNLTEVLISMGISDAFGLLADFSGMDGKKDLFISRVSHKAIIDVNEEGTEVTAVTTGNIMVGEKPIVPVFKADHPFIFLIRDNSSGSILFFGRVTDPSTSPNE